MKLLTLSLSTLLSGCVLNMLAARSMGHGSYDPADDPDAKTVYTSPTPFDKASLDRGAALFKKNCVECHGPKGIGDGPKSKETTPPVANLTKVKDTSDTHLFKQITFGREDMPVWKDKLSEKNIWDLVNYVKSLSGKKL
jgi:mono/diheme cytochrome c family protein